MLTNSIGLRDSLSTEAMLTTERFSYPLSVCSAPMGALGELLRLGSFNFKFGIKKRRVLLLYCLALEAFDSAELLYTFWKQKR